MARGSSGRIVIEVDPTLKNDVYLELARTGTSLKDWFLREAELLIEGRKKTLFDKSGHHRGAKRAIQRNSRGVGGGE
jgi:hypothetical protein